MGAYEVLFIVVKVGTLDGPRMTDGVHGGKQRKDANFKKGVQSRSFGKDFPHVTVLLHIP